MTVNNGTYAGLNMYFMQGGRRFNIDALDVTYYALAVQEQRTWHHWKSRSWDITDLKLEYLQALLHPEIKLVALLIMVLQ